MRPAEMAVDRQACCATNRSIATQIKVPVPLPQILDQYAAGRQTLPRVICLRPGP
jgi:hypothetical protein